MQLTERNANASAGQTHNLNTSEWSASSSGHIQQETWQTPRDGFDVHVESESLIWGHQPNKDCQTLRLLCVTAYTTGVWIQKSSVQYLDLTNVTQVAGRGDRAGAANWRRDDSETRKEVKGRVTKAARYTKKRNRCLGPWCLRRPVCCQPVTSVSTRKVVPWSDFIWISYTTFNSSEVTSQGRDGLLKEFSILDFIKICAATP